MLSVILDRKKMMHKQELNQMDPKCIIDKIKEKNDIYGESLLMAKKRISSLESQGMPRVTNQPMMIPKMLRSERPV